MTVLLLGVPASHPVLAAELMLRRKGMSYRRLDVPSGVQRLVLRLLRFPARTVPVLFTCGRRVQGTMQIARFLDGLQPEPALVSVDARALEVERWADDVLQDNARRLGQLAAKRDPGSLREIALASALGFPKWMVRALLPILVPLVLGRLPVTADDARARLAQLPAHLDRIDAMIADGVIGGEEPNAADYQVGTSVRLLMLIDQVRPFVERRPAGRLALRLVPEYPGRFAPAFPEEWLEPLRAGH